MPDQRTHAPTRLPRARGGGAAKRRRGSSLIPPRTLAGRCHAQGARTRRAAAQCGLSSPLPIAYCLLPVLITLLFLPACVQRRIRVTSTPPGARVIINDQDIGVTPVETRFTFYGGYDLQLLLDGYEPVHQLRQAKAPLYEYPGPDLIATALPLDLKNTIEWHFDLTQVPEATDPEQAREDLLNRATELRERAKSE